MGSRRSTLRASLILALRTTEEVSRPRQWANDQERLADLGKLELPPCLDRTVSYLLDEYQRQVSPKRLGQAHGMNPTLYQLSDIPSRRRRAGSST